MRNYTSNQFSIRKRLMRCPTRCHTRNPRGRRTFPLNPPPTAEISKVDANVQTLKTLEPAPPRIEAPPSILLDVPRLHLFDR